MSVSLGDMHAHLVQVIAVAHLARAAEEAADRALSDAAAETHHQDIETHCTHLVQLICGTPGKAIMAALADEMQAVIVDLGDCEIPAQVSA
jgi:hypothetical protein